MAVNLKNHRCSQVQANRRLFAVASPFKLSSLQHLPALQQPPTMSVLYLDHFNLSADPFRITPDTAFFFSGGQRGDFLEALVVASMHDEGIVSVVGEIGMGKTMLSRMLLERLRLLPCDTVYLANPVFDRDEILEAIARDLMPAPPRGNRTHTLAILESALLERHAQGRRVVVVIDEAHSMPGATLEEIRLLSNLETSHHKLLKMVLFGQPELDELLNSPRLRQVKDRISHRFELQPFNAQEACSYLTFRLQKAGWQGGDLFDAASHKLLVQASEGRTRKLNMLADKSMLAAYAEGLPLIGIEQVRRAVGDSLPQLKKRLPEPVHAAHPTPTPERKTFKSNTVLALGVLAILGLGYAVGYGTRQKDHSVPVQANVPAASKPQAASRQIAADPLTTPSAASSAPADLAAPGSPHTMASARVEPTVTAASSLSATASPSAIALPASASPVSALLLSQLRDNSLEIRTQATNSFFAAQSDRGFTVQVLAQRAPRQAEVIGVAQKIQAELDALAVQAGKPAPNIPVLVHDRLYQNVLFHAVYVGHFENREDALRFIETSSPTVRRYKPVVRSLEAIRKETAS